MKHSTDRLGVLKEALVAMIQYNVCSFYPSVTDFKFGTITA